VGKFGELIHRRGGLIGIHRTMMLMQSQHFSAADCGTLIT
jgi:hypothetical protein